MVANLNLHPLCTLFPRLAGAEFDALKADILANGQREPIVVHEGLVLDGGNRYRACIEAGIEPLLKEFVGADPVAFVLSANLHRRHLTPGQQAAIVASAQDWTRAQSAGGDRKSDQSATLHLDSVGDRAAQSGASVRTQKMADKVAKASPELAMQVAHGEISLPKALEQLAPRAPMEKKSAPAATELPPAIDQPSAETYQPPVDICQPLVSTHTSPLVLAPAEQGVDGPADEAEPFEQLMADFQALQVKHDAAVDRVHELEVLLAQNDLAAKVDALTHKCAQFDSLATSRFNEIAELKRVIDGQRGFLEVLRKAAGLPKGGDLATWIKHAAQRAA